MSEPKKDPKATNVEKTMMDHLTAARDEYSKQLEKETDKTKRNAIVKARSNVRTAMAAIARITK